ncbi:NAD(+) diphosphatase [Clostridium sp. OS1-26]|uniref:NAD(+) diphosphatase n=1 Tax=Clostridium sp. OS1-26 TaxID=3070681 RepID=UPI0027E0074A|nr:NAD(+) diphosphatase [Clostridium sp. OS1-26]WML34123.1 NAD(+) diphosphatase [Clostridium sp. OS1-26]
MKRFYFIFNSDELLVKIKDKHISFINDDDMNFLKISLINSNSFVSEDNNEYIFGELDKQINVIEPFQFIKIRSLIALLDIPLFNLASRALHLLNWNRTYKYCNKCGSPLMDKDDERAKVCPSCGLIVYPRISPAIITAVVKDNKLLLAHNVNFNKDVYSVIAGFVEPGESFEACVAREVFEEIGIQVKNVKYFGSQPWPFPDSLMVAFTCEYSSGEIKVDGIEISDADWYSVEELPKIPTKGSIARNLIEWFVDNYRNTKQ